MMRRLHEIHCTALHACVLLGVLLPGVATAVAPRLEVQARIRQDTGQVVQRTVAPGAMLRSGDAVRVRVTAASDGYLYVIALDSSGTVEVLHPFAGPAEPVRAGEERAVPRDGGFLPLDSRTGREHLLAFVANEPLESLARLLVRLEAAGTEADAASVRKLLASEGFDAAHLTFDHGPAAVAVAPAPAGPLAAGAAAAASPQREVPAPRPAADDAGTSEVLSGLGSRIARFTSEVAADRAERPVAGGVLSQPAVAVSGSPSRASRSAGGTRADQSLPATARTRSQPGLAPSSTPDARIETAPPRVPQVPPPPAMPPLDHAAETRADAPGEVAPRPRDPLASAPAPDATGRDSDTSGGWLAGLGVFFGGGPEPAPTADATPAAREDHEPPRNTGPGPTLSRRVDESGRRVVILDGAVPARQRDSEVLSGAGSRIRALLGEPDPPHTGAVSTPTEERRAGHVAPEVPAQAGPAPPTSPTPAPPAAARAQAQAQAKVTAAPEAASLELAPRVPAIPVARPGPGPGAPTFGAAVAGSEPTAAVAPLPAAPARAVAQSTVRLAQVDLSSNAGAAAAVVMVVTPEGATSGVLVNERGHVLTNWHSVRAYDAVLVLFKQTGGTGPAVGTRSVARLIAHSKFADLALLQVDSLPSGIAPPVLVSRVEVDGGAPLHAIGPDDDGQWRHSVATVDRIRRNSSWYSTRRVLHRADVVRAEMADPQEVAGVPLFNNALELVGLGAMSRHDKGELIGISAGTLRTFLAAAGD